MKINPRIGSRKVKQTYIKIRDMLITSYPTESYLAANDSLVSKIPTGYIMKLTIATDVHRKTDIL